MAEADYSSDIYQLIYSHISHKKIPIEGCWKLSDNSRKAIRILHYDKCPFKTEDWHINQLKYLEPNYGEMVDCELCDHGFGYHCCNEYSERKMIALFVQEFSIRIFIFSVCISF